MSRSCLFLRQTLLLALRGRRPAYACLARFPNYLTASLADVLLCPFGTQVLCCMLHAIGCAAIWSMSTKAVPDPRRTNRSASNSKWVVQFLTEADYRLQRCARMTTHQVYGQSLVLCTPALLLVLATANPHPACCHTPCCSKATLCLCYFCLPLLPFSTARLHGLYKCQGLSVSVIRSLRLHCACFAIVLLNTDTSGFAVIGTSDTLRQSMEHLLCCREPGQLHTGACTAQECKPS